MKGIIRDMFLGGNTSKGFYSFYEYILSQEEATRIICIKGGPGTGKSMLMKNIGTTFYKKNYDIEYHHCSSDSDSLDGVVIKDLNIALLDGTAPHIVDPKNPGAVDEILNMGNCWNENNLRKYKNEIINTNNEIKNTFKSAYKYLAAAKLIRDNWSAFFSEAQDFSKINILKEDLKNKIFKPEVTNMGFDRHLFATAFTPNGIITYIDTLCNDYKNIYVLNGEPGTGKNDILKFLSTESLRRGYYTEIYHNPLIPEHIEHVLIPSLNTAIVTSNEINKREFNGHQIYLENYLNSNMIFKYKNEIIDNKNIFYNLLDKGLEIISHVKFLHDNLEKYYIDNMDFEKVNKISNKIINKIFKYEEQYLLQK